MIIHCMFSIQTLNPWSYSDLNRYSTIHSAGYNRCKIIYKRNSHTRELKFNTLNIFYSMKRKPSLSGIFKIIKKISGI